MAYDIKEGSNTIRPEFVDSLIKQTAQRSYKFKQAVVVVPTNAWTNIFYREDQTPLSSNNPVNLIRNIPRGANIPQIDPSFQEARARIVEFKAETNIAIEDIWSSNISVQSRSIIRMTESLTKNVDDYLFQQLCDTFFNDSLVGYNSEDLVIQSYAVGTGTAGATYGRWNETSCAIWNDVGGASRLIGEANYETNDLLLFVSPKDKQNILRYVADKGTQWQTLASDILVNGAFGKIAGATIIESMSVPASYALLVKPKTCATYKEMRSLTSNTTEDPLKSVRIRVAEAGTLELTDPKCVVLIKNTLAGV